MNLFLWNKNFETGLPNIDQQHRQLVEVINRFGSQITQDKLAIADLEEIFSELFAYTKYHFEEEERLMTGMKIDPRHHDHHTKEHAEFIQDLNFMHRDLSFREGGFGHSLLQFLNNWLAYHLLGSDKNLALQVEAIKGGMSPAKAFDSQNLPVDHSTKALLGAMSNLFKLVSERNRQLVEMNWSLEEKVATRTLALSEANRSLEALALTDVLTQLPNRRHAMRRLAHFWDESLEHKTPLSCMMIDADGFKYINDNFGHISGDSVLYALARRMREAVRTDDIVCRLGGDEFLVICPLTPLKGALHVAELLRRAVAELRVPVVNGEWQGSVSIGVAARIPKMKSPDDLIKMADEGVYAAKHAGRNCVRVAVT